MNYQEYFFPWLLNMFKATLSPFLCQPVCLLVTCVPVISTIQGQGLFWHFPHQVSFLDFCYKTSSLFSTLIFDSPFSFFFFPFGSSFTSLKMSVFQNSMQVGVITLLPLYHQGQPQCLTHTRSSIYCVTWWIFVGK